MKIQTKGLKGSDLDLKLSKLNLLTGPNGSGKSAVADAICFGALGYVPRLGKRPADTAALMSAEAMRVDVTLDDGRSFYRELGRAPKGFAGAVESSWLKNAKPNEHAGAVLQLFGREEQDVAEVLDIRELLAATPNQRAARIEQLMAAGAATPKERALRVAELTTRRLAQKEDAKLANWRVLVEILPQEQVSILRDRAGMLEAKIIEGGTSAALTWANAEKRRADADVKHKRDAAKELETRLNGIAKADPARIDALAEERDGLQRQVGAATKQNEQAHKAKSDYGHAGMVRSQAAREVEMLEAAIKRDHPTDNQRAETDEQIEKARHSLAELAEPQAPVMDPPDELKQADRAEKEARNIIMLEEVHHVAEGAEVGRLTVELAAAEKSPWQRVRAIGDELIRKGTAMPEGVELVALAKTHTPDLDALREVLSVKSVALAELRARAKQIREKNDGWRLKQSKLLEKATTLRGTAAQIMADRREAWDRSSAEARERRRALTEKLADLTKRRDALLAAASTAKDALERARQTLAGVDGKLAGIGQAGEIVDTLPMTARLALIQAEHETLSRAQAARSELEQIVKAVETLEAEVTVFKALEWALQRLREQELNESGGVLLGTIRKFLEAAGRAEKPQLAAKQGSCEIGWLRPDGKQVSVQAMSGGEYALFTAALTSAVTIARGAPVRVLLVEAGEADLDTLAEIMCGIEAVSDRLTVALVLTHSAALDTPTGWTPHRFDHAKLATVRA